MSRQFLDAPELTSPPDSNVGVYFDTGDEVEYYYSVSRSKWLSLEEDCYGFGFSSSHVSATAMKSGVVTHTFQIGFSFARIATLVGVQMRDGDSGTASLLLKRFGEADVDLGTPNANGDLYDMALDIDVVSATKGGLYPYWLQCDGAGGYECGSLFYRWRQS